MGNVNVWAVLAATVSSFVLGGIWYSSLLFGRTWEKELGRKGRINAQDRHPALVFGFSLVLAFVTAWLLARMLEPEWDVAQCVRTSLKVGAGFVAASFAINDLFGGGSFKLWAINGSYHVARFAIYGLILGYWR
jgi:hypothetical protein